MLFFEQMSASAGCGHVREVPAADMPPQRLRAALCGSRDCLQRSGRIPLRRELRGLLPVEVLLVEIGALRPLGVVETGTLYFCFTRLLAFFVFCAFLATRDLPICPRTTIAPPSPN